MSVMLDKLLKGQKVEWLRIAEVGELVRGNGLQKSDFTESGVPAIHYGQIYTFYGNSTAETKSFVSPELAEKLRKVNKGDVVITNTSENLEDVGKALLYLGEKQAVTGGHATIFKPSKKIIGKYFVYLTQSDFFANQKRKYAKGTKVIDVSATDMAKILVPIPPLDVQAKIVKILDAFTALTAELTAELTMREKQYHYYRDKLLSFSNRQIEWTTLDKVSLVIDSLHQTPKYSENGLSMIRVTDIKGGLINLHNTLKVNQEIFDIFTKKYLPKKFDLVMSRVGSYGNVSIIPEDNAVCMGQNTVVINPLINSHFLYHVLNSKTTKAFIEKNVGGGNQKTLSLKSIKEIPIPSINEEEQNKIAEILNNFENLINSVSEGLPREIALRQKQYEYYREQLLDFPK
jgi:type I restriction enzyme S subunit